MSMKPWGPCRLGPCLVACLALVSVATAQENLDLTHVPARAVAAAVIHPRQLTQRPEWELMPWEIMQVAAQQEFGIDPLALERVLLIAPTPNPAAPPEWGAVLTFSQPQQLAIKLLEQTEAASVGSTSYQRALRPDLPSFCQVNPQTLVVGAESLLREMIAANDAASPLRNLLSSVPLQNDITVVVAVSELRDLARQALGQAPPLPPPLQPLLQAPEQIDTAMLALNLSRDRVSGIKLIATDADAAEQLENALKQALGFAKQMLLAQAMREMTEENPAMQEAQQRYLQRVADALEGRLQPVRNGKQLLLTVNADYATTGVMVALLLPAVQAARESARRMQGSNNLKQIALALLNYHDTFNRFPAAYTMDDAGKPLLSWRVHILPFVEQRELYDQFHLDEPWDSPHNRELIAYMPEIYRAPGSAAEPGKTNYLGVRGDDKMFVTPKASGRQPQGVGLRDVTDGTSNTLMVVEAGDESAVEWTRPADFQPDMDDPTAGLTGLRPGSFQASFVDGSVRMISMNVDPEMLRRLFVRNDGKIVTID